ncbi:OLC1v1013263C1 [Oldenlandia corymbosa var. corymbosa]|uniref:OLC1v1013263C1 n=1 Tax=Oldenlandia corymbosa var. corymbosa TaxID=529605 RepID=A0AAV1DZW8_OLDCO|nr:OLC1v1013263C1 [Oldenlandia corymbosa var. corymbosa]
MERKSTRNAPNPPGKGSSASLQKQLVESRRPKTENVPDLTDFMNDMFFGVAPGDKKVYNLTGDDRDRDDSDRDSFDSSRRSVSSRSTQEWLEEAKRMVAQSPTRNESPSRLVGSPRFATVQQQSTNGKIDKRNPLSRSARRHRQPEGFGGEILSKSAQHNRNKSQSNALSPEEEESSGSAVHKWFSNILKPHHHHNNSNLPPETSSPPNPINNNNHLLGSPPLPPSRQMTPRKSRFLNSANSPQSNLIPPFIPHTNEPFQKRTFKTPANLNATATNSHSILDNRLLSPPKHLNESAHRRSISASTCSVPDSSAMSLSPPRNLSQSTHRNSISGPHDLPARNLFESHRRSTSSSATHNQDRNRTVLPRDNFIAHYHSEESKNSKLNGFLKDQRNKVEEIMSGESNKKAKIILSGSSNSTSSMVAAISYAWLLEYRMRANNMEERDQEGVDGEIVVPVINMRRGKMWKQKQAAWLFHHVGIDASALLFSDEVDLETLMMSRKLSILIVGQDILKTNGEVGSVCTILTDNYCEDAYDLLETPMLKKLLLAGILLDTQNLNVSMKLCTTRDSEATQLFLVGSSPTYRNSLFEKLMQDQRDGAFSEVLEKNYGRPSSERNSSKEPSPEQQVSDKIFDHGVVVPNVDKIPKEVKRTNADTNTLKQGKPTPPPAKPPTPAKAAADASRGKNGFFLAKWFGFGSK